MPENKPNSVAVKVPKGVYDSLNDAQDDIRRKTGVKPALADLLADAWDAYTRNSSGAAESVNIRRTNPPKVGDDSDLSEMIPSHLRDWMDLVERAVTVQDATWVSMLSSIRHQLEIVAGHADREKGSDIRDGKGSGRSPRVGGSGKGAGGPTQGGNQKAG